MKVNNKYLRFTSVSFQMIILVGGGTLLGMYIDNEHSKTYTITLSLLGVFLGLYLVIKEALNMTKK